MKKFLWIADNAIANESRIVKGYLHFNLYSPYLILLT